MSNKRKSFDCIKMKREIQARIYDDTKDMTHEEFMDYLQQKVSASRFAEKLHDRELARKAV